MQNKKRTSTFQNRVLSRYNSPRAWNLCRKHHSPQQAATNTEDNFASHTETNLQLKVTRRKKITLQLTAQLRKFTVFLWPN